jgi:hypothetical protein
LGHFSAITRALSGRFRRGKGSPARPMLPRHVAVRALPSRPYRAASPPRRARGWRTPTAHRRHGTAGGQFCSPYGDTFVDAVPFPYVKVGRIYFLRGRIIAADSPCCCCDAAFRGQARLHPRQRPPFDVRQHRPGEQDRASERSAFSVRAARFHPARALLHDPCRYRKCSTIIHDFVAKRDYRKAQPREAQPATSSGKQVNRRPCHPFGWPEQAPASTRRRRITPRALCAFTPLVMEWWIV